MKKILIIFTLFAFAQTAYAANPHWVSPNGTATYSGCQSATPLVGTAACFLGTAGSSALAGDVVYLVASTSATTMGIYNTGGELVPAHSGTAGNPITFAAYPGQNIVLSSQYLPNPNMATSSWPACTSSDVCTSGAAVSWGNRQTYAGLNSTEFVTTTTDQGIWTGYYNLPFPSGSPGYDFGACIYSNANVVHENVANGSSSIIYSHDLVLNPNIWTCYATEFITNNGNFGPNAYISFTSTSSAPAATFYVTLAFAHSYESVITLNAKSYINISGINVQDVDSGFNISDGSSYNEIASSTFTGSNPQYTMGAIYGPNAGTETPGSDYNLIIDDTFHDNGQEYPEPTDTSNYCQENGDTLRLGGLSGAIDDYSFGNLVTNSTFYHAIHDLILVGSRYNSITDNVFHNEDWFPNPDLYITQATIEDALSTTTSQSYANATYTWLQQNGFIVPSGVNAGVSLFRTSSTTQVSALAAYATSTPVYNILYQVLSWYTGCGLVVNAPGFPNPLLGARSLIPQAPTGGSHNYAGYTLIENNRIGPEGIPRTQGANGIENSVNGNIIRFNYFYGAAASGYYEKLEGQDEETQSPSYNHIYNNTFYANGLDPSESSEYQGGIYFVSPFGAEATSTGNVVMNNIVYGNSTPYAGLVSSAWVAQGNTLLNNSTSTNPLFVNPATSSTYSLTVPNMSLLGTSPVAQQSVPLTYTSSTDSGTGTTLVVDDPMFFQDGSWCPPGFCQPDWIIVGTGTPPVEIASIATATEQSTGVITLATPITRSPNSPVWLYSGSDGSVMYYNTYPNLGAFQSFLDFVGTVLNGILKLTGLSNLQ